MESSRSSMMVHCIYCCHLWYWCFRFLGVWDTVGSVGLPGGLITDNNIFGFNDSLLGDHIERACQALAIGETRQDFVSSILESTLLYAHKPVAQICNKLHQTPAGKAKDQYVKQVWFSGAHSDVCHQPFLFLSLYMTDTISRSEAVTTITTCQTSR